MSEVASASKALRSTRVRTARMPLWTSLGLVAPLEARISGGLPRGGAPGISIDTRTLQPGDLFFAINGLEQRRP